MKNKPKRIPYLPLSIAGLAVILFSGAGIAHIAGWNPISSGGTGSVLVLDGLPAVKVKCAECGVIISMREIKARKDSADFVATVAGNPDEMRVKPARHYEFTIRMADSSVRLVNEENSASWRLGERVMVIDGISPSSR